MKQALVVGAGAVGQVYGHHLQRAGFEVSLLVRPPHLARAREGFWLYRLVRGGSLPPARFEAARVFGAVAEVAAERFSLVLLCVPSNALAAPGWLEELAASTGDATLVALQPGVEDAARVVAAAGAERVVAGRIGLVAYAAPLLGERIPRPGTAYWIPPFAKLPVSGPRADEVVAALRRGGLPMVRHADVSTSTAFGAAFLDTHMAALECAGFSLQRLREDRALLALAQAAAREATAITARHHGVRAPAATRLLGGAPVRWLTRLAPALVPFDLEAFLRAHYTKVGTQTRALFADYRRLAARHGLGAEAIGELERRIGVAS